MRQNLVGTAPVMQWIGYMLINGGDVCKFWAAMLLTQVVFHNPMTVAKFLEADGIQAISEVMILAEEQRCQRDRGELDDIGGANHAAVRSKQKTRAERRAAGLEEELVSERAQLPCLSAVCNILWVTAGESEAWEHVVATERPAPAPLRAYSGEARKMQSKTRGGGSSPNVGLVSACSSICFRGRRLEVPLLVSAASVCLALARTQGAVKALLRAGVVQNLKQHIGQETVEGLAAVEITRLVTNAAAVRLQKYARGHHGRRVAYGLAEDTKVEHLKGFARRLSFTWAIKEMRQHARSQKKVKAFVAKFFGSKEVDGPKNLGFDAFVIYVGVSRERCGKAERMRVFSRTARDDMFERWIDHMVTEVAELNEAVAKKCKNVLAMMSSDAFGRAFREWRDQCRKAKAVKRRWLHGAIDRGWRAWRAVMDELYALHKLVQQRCSRVTAMIAGEYVQLCFKEWAGIVGKKKRAMAKFLNACLNCGFTGWCEYVDEETSTREAVFEKCRKLLSMLATDGVTMAFKNWAKYVYLRINSNRMKKLLGRRALEDGFDALCGQLDEMFELMRQCREKCSRTIAYMGGGFVIEYFKEWAKLWADARKARFKWRNAAMVVAWRAWVQEYMPRARLMRKIGQRFKTRFERMVMWLWRGVVVQAAHDRIILLNVMKMMTNVRFIGPLRTWVEFAETSKRYRMIVDRFKRRFELRVAGIAMHGWRITAQTDAYKRRRLQVLTNRIKKRILILFMNNLTSIMEDKLALLKASLVEKSDLLARWTKRPMISCFELWDDLVVEEARKAALLKRLRYRIQNNCIVLTFAQWKVFVGIARGERHAVLASGVRGTLSLGSMRELESAMGSHPCCKKRYASDGSRRVLASALAASIAAQADPRRHREDGKSEHVPGGVSELVRLACVMPHIAPQHRGGGSAPPLLMSL